MSSSWRIRRRLFIAIVAAVLVVAIVLLMLPALPRGPSIEHIVGRETDLSGRVWSFSQSTGENDTWINVAEIEVSETEYRRFIEQFGLQECDSERTAAFNKALHRLALYSEDLVFKNAEVYCNADSANRLSVAKLGNRMYVYRVVGRNEG